MTTTTPTSEMVRIGDTELCIHHWKNSSSSPTTASSIVCIVYHGFLAHGRYPTVRYAAESLANLYPTISCDFRGHGQSPGVRGYLPSADQLVQDAVGVANYARTLQPSLDDNDKPKLLLIGSSMGGTIALSVAEVLGEDAIAGVVLLAPMLRLNVSAPARSLLGVLASVVPTWQVIPSSSTSPEQQYRDPVKRQECQDDELSISGSNIRVGSASTCVELAANIQTKFDSITVPLLIMVAEEDVVVDSQGAQDLYQQAPSQDKTLKSYPSLHGLLCEPSPLVDTIQDDMLEWVKERSSK